ncbi:hypothetical protein HYV10_00635 [Candidatus Dependentiae bacterium]|nr:hypothetical protein [Candidatus Dependentiae bacterium]
MIKRISLIFSLAGIHTKLISKNVNFNLTEQTLKQKKETLRKFSRELKNTKKSNPLPGTVEKLENKIKILKDEIKNLKKEQRTSNTFFKRKNDIEARATMDPRHGQPIYDPNYFQLEEPSYDLHEQLTTGYFPNH